MHAARFKPSWTQKRATRHAKPARKSPFSPHPGRTTNKQPIYQKSNMAKIFRNCFLPVFLFFALAFRVPLRLADHPRLLPLPLHQLARLRAKTHGRRTTSPRSKAQYLIVACFCAAARRHNPSATPRVHGHGAQEGQVRHRRQEGRGQEGWLPCSSPPPSVFSLPFFFLFFLFLFFFSFGLFVVWPAASRRHAPRRAAEARRGWRRLRACTARAAAGTR